MVTGPFDCFFLINILGIYMGGFALPATYHHFLNSLLPAITEYVLSGLKKVMY